MRIVQYSYPTARSLAPLFNLTSRSPWAGLEEEMNRLFLSALSNTTPTTGNGSFSVDLYDDKENTYVRAELPGVKKEDIGVELVDGFLTLQATRKQKTGEREESVSYSRSVMISEDVKSDQVSATYENSILTVKLPKQEESKPKKVSVSVN
jgi:HSP20 family protein